MEITKVSYLTPVAMCECLRPAVWRLVTLDTTAGLDSKIPFPFQERMLCIECAKNIDPRMANPKLLIQRYTLSPILHVDEKT